MPTRSKTRPGVAPSGTEGIHGTAARLAASRLDPQDMLTFAAIARAGGIRGATAGLGAPRSTVSRRLAQLEAAVGAPLVVRTSRRFALTELGRALAGRCEQLEELLRASEDFVRRAAVEPAGVLRISAAPLLGEEVLPPVLAEYLRRYARVRVEVQVSADYVDLRRGVDVALRTGALEDATDLFATRLGVIQVGHYAGPAYVRQRGAPEAPAELAQHDCIAVGGGSRPSVWMFRKGSREQRVDVVPRLRVDNFRVARAVAASGGGIVRLATFYATPLLDAGELVPILEDFWPRVPIFAVHSSGTPTPLKIRAFLDLVREVVRQRLPQEPGPGR